MNKEEFLANLGEIKTGARESDRFVAKILSALDANQTEFTSLVDVYFESRSKLNNNTKVLGITGAPGVGKSTFINFLIPKFTEAGYSVAVLAFDPASRESGGSILGDRIRCAESLSVSKAFFRSFSSKGAYGGVSASCASAIKVLKLFDYDVVLVETVGVGQNEIEVRKVSDIVVVIFDPNSGDSIQTDKSGVTEIGDLYLINKSDLNQNRIMEKNLREAINWRMRNSTRIPLVIPTTSNSLESLEVAFNEIKHLLFTK